MLTPRSLTLSGIGRFVTKQTVNFDEMGQLVQIDGQNLNTGGSSGSGKTTLFNAMEYNLGLNDLPVTVLQSRLTKDGIYTEAVYDWDGKEVILVRGKGKLSITVDGTPIEGSAKLVEEKIVEMMGMHPDLFRPIFHKRQKEGGFFLAMTPSKIHEFLTSILNLGDYAKKIELLDKNVKELTVIKEKTEVAVKTSRSALQATQDAILALGLAPIRDMHQSVVLELKNKMDASATVLSAVVASHKEQNLLLDSRRISNPPPPQTIQPELDNTPYDLSRLKIHEAEKKDLLAEAEVLKNAEISRVAHVRQIINDKKISLSTLNYKEAIAQTAKNTALQIAQEIKSIRACVCPTCKQQWIADAAKEKETELLEKLNDCKNKISAGVLALVQTKELQAEIESLTLQISPTETYLKQLAICLSAAEIIERFIKEEKANFDAFQNTQNAANKALLAEYEIRKNKDLNHYHEMVKHINDEFATEQQALRHSQSIEMDQARGQADVDRRAFDAAVSKLRAYEEANSRYTSSLNSLKTQEETYLKQIDSSLGVLVKTEASIVIAEESKRAVKSFMSCSFDEALDEIGDAATRTIRAIPNMANATVQFQGVRETLSGKIKEEVNAVITMDGEEGIDIRSLSGGERSSADLAIDLAVIDLIENRSNKGVSVFILDEPFTGLDTVSIEMVLELLKNVKTNKKLIIVDHNESVKEMVSSRIIAVRNGTTSTIVQ